MEISRKVIMSPSSSKISATFEVQKPSYGSRANRKGPRSDADLIYTTAIAASSGGRSSGSSETSSTASSSGKEQQHDDHDDADADDPPREYNEVIYLLPYYPSRIRFWVDERAVDDPRVAREQIREGRKGDAANCSVIEIRFISAEEDAAAATAAAKPRDAAAAASEQHLWTCDIYIPPSRLINKIWVYRDPTKNRPGSPLHSHHHHPRNPYQQHHFQQAGSAPAVGAPRPSTQPQQQQQRSKQAWGRMLPSRPRTTSTPYADAPAVMPLPLAPALVPARSSSLRYPLQQRALPTPPAASAPALALQQTHRPDALSSSLPSSLHKHHHAADPRRVRVVVPEPEGFKNNYLADISRLASRNGAFCLVSDARSGRGGDGRAGNSDDDDDDDDYRSVFDDDDDDEDAASFSTGSDSDTHMGAAAVQPPTRKLSFKDFVGRRARKSVFHTHSGGGGAHGASRIDVSEVQAPRQAAEFEKPSVMTKLVARAIRRLARDDIH